MGPSTRGVPRRRRGESDAGASAARAMAGVKQQRVGKFDIRHSKFKMNAKQIHNSEQNRRKRSCGKHAMHFPFLIRGRVVLAAVLVHVLLVARIPATGQEERRGDVPPEIAQAIAVLASPAARQEKVNACRRLAALGGQESVAPLAAILFDNDLSHAARMGLEAIPDLAAGEALRAALPGLSGGPLIGVIHSLAARREARAVPDLGRYLTDGDPQVAAAACAALGTIASADAMALLEDAQSRVREDVRAEWARACLRGVPALRAQGLDDQAARLCQLLRHSQLPAHLHSAATRLAMLIRPGDAGPLLEELLASADDASFAMALTVGRELDSPQVTQILMASLATLPLPRRTQVVRLLGDRGDPVARDALVQCAGGSDVAVRAA
ncbi:MAG: hypothetical protein FJ276_00400, partial [Planctomycetes bacterium]|nr:hypothetical protein [Planctomycetota bacterium]